MAAIDPGFRRNDRLQLLLRRGTRLTAAAFYVTALVFALILVQPAFHSVSAPVEVTPPPPPQTDTLRKGESVATFAARHGLDLGELLALNPRVNSLALPAGTNLRIR